MASSTRITRLTGTVGVAAALLASMIAATPANAQSAAASSCTSFTLDAASSTVRRGGRVALEGEAACGDAYTSSAPTPVQVQLKKGRRWTTVANSQTFGDGSFSACAKVAVPKQVKVARLRVNSAAGPTGGTTLRVSSKGSTGCPADDSSHSTESPSGPPAPPTPPPPPGTLLREDPATSSDPMPLWNAVDAQSASRHQQFTSGAQDGGPFRRLTVQDGDDYWGERAELGHNSRVGGLGAPWGTFFLYNAGDRRVTDFWMRLPSSFPINANTWQVVMQMKQTGPSNGSSGTPALALEARQGKWVLTQSDSPGYHENTHEVWSTPATVGVWTHIKLDVTYSPDPSQGKLQISVDDVNSPTFTTFTQKYELSPGDQGLAPGAPIPSHLRMGIYHNASLPGTHVDFADVKVSTP